MLFALDILCLWVMVSIRRLLQLPLLTSLLYQVFTRFVCFTGNTLSTFSCSDQIVAKINVFSKTIFFFQLIAGQFWFCCFVYMFIWVLFHSSAILKLQIASYLHICIASYLASHQIMWHNKRIHGHGLKITNCCFFSFQGNKVWGWYYLLNFKLLISFWECT